VSILAELLGGVSSIKWSTGFSLLAKAVESTPALRVDTKSNIYSDAGLLTISLHGTAADIRNGASKVVEALKGVAQNLSKEDFQKAQALAKFKEYEYATGSEAGIALTGTGIVRDGKAYQTEDVASAIDGASVDKVKAFAKEILEGKASVSAVGDLYVLPYAEELGLTV
jgi:ubiquinol-cytochrome c reductase core subunit 2